MICNTHILNPVVTKQNIQEYQVMNELALRITLISIMILITKVLLVHVPSVQMKM